MSNKNKQINNQLNQSIFKNLPNFLSLTCEKCGSDIFEQIYIIKKIPAVYSNSGREENMPIPAFRCGDCHNINNEFISPKLREKKVKHDK